MGTAAKSIIYTLCCCQLSVVSTIKDGVSNIKDSCLICFGEVSKILVNYKGGGVVQLLGSLEIRHCEDGRLQDVQNLMSKQKTAKLPSSKD